MRPRALKYLTPMVSALCRLGGFLREDPTPSAYPPNFSVQAPPPPRARGGETTRSGVGWGLVAMPDPHPSVPIRVHPRFMLFAF